MTDIIHSLQTFADSCISSSDRTIALIAAAWIADNSSAAKHPLLADIIKRATAGPPTRMPRSVLDFFTLEAAAARSGGATANAAANTSPPSALSMPSASAQPMRIYSDGACTNNGRRGARAAMGVSVQNAHGEVEAISRPLGPAEPQTNQRAELRALAYAIKRAASGTTMCDIYTDSQYAINCLTVWATAWSRRNWTKACGGDVLHRDVIEPMWDEYRSAKHRIQIHHVSAHTGRTDIHSRGNARADQLAVAGLEA